MNLAINKRPFIQAPPPLALHYGTRGGAEIFVERGGGGCGKHMEKVKEAKISKKGPHMKKPPPTPIKKRTFFSGGGLRAYSVPQAGDPVFNTINTHSGEYAAIPLNIVPSNTISITFVYKIIIFVNFFDKIAAKYTPKRTKLHHFFFNFLGGACPRTPLTNAWLCHAQHCASRHAYIPTFGN